jgi:hypothetical protein
MAQSKRAKVANYLRRLNFRSPLGSANDNNGLAALTGCSARRQTNTGTNIIRWRPCLRRPGAQNARATRPRARALRPYGGAKWRPNLARSRVLLLKARCARRRTCLRADHSNDINRRPQRVAQRAAHQPSAVSQALHRVQRQIKLHGPRLAKRRKYSALAPMVSRL